MLNRTADTIDVAYPFPAKIRVKIAPYFVRAGALCIFMAKAIIPVSMITNEIKSLHVTYISTTSFPEPEKDGMIALSAAL